MLQKRTSAPASWRPRSSCPDSNDHASAARMLSFSSVSRSSQAACPARVSSGSAVSASSTSASRCRSRDVLELAALREPLERVLADRLEHPEPRLALGALGLADEPVVDERGDAVQHLAELEPERAAGDGLGGLERAPRRRRRGARRAPCPCRRAGCSSTRSRRGASPARRRRQEREALLLEPREDLLRRHQLDAGSRHLDRERDALEPRADLRDGRAGCPVSSKLGFASCARSRRARPPGSRRCRPRLRARRAAAPAYSRSPRTRSGVRLVATTFRPGARVEELADRRRRRQHLLEVVEHEQRRPVAEALGDRLGERLLGDSRTPSTLGDRGADEVARPASARGRRSTPPRTRRCRVVAASSARRVLPVPPSPLSVTRRTRLSEQLEHRRELVVAADDRRGGHRQSRLRRRRRRDACDMTVATTAPVVAGARRARRVRRRSSRGTT